MFPGFDKIVEERIKKAQKKGDFKDLPGSGKPLDLEDEGRVAEDLRLAYKILKNADFTPPEIEIKNEIKKTEDLLANMKDEKEKYRTLKKLNFLILKLNSMRNASINFDLPQQYVEKVAGRMEAKGKKE
ncbi:MAG: DnaJ family domain-containing protein [Thermodesulfobacteriota bacterium]|nr:DnaJ family domain-containing protein [Thermodesulfobacteriota bacterium]